MANNFFSFSRKIYLLLHASLIVFTLTGKNNSEAFYKWVDEKGVIHFTDRPVNRRQAETAKLEIKTLKKYTDDFEDGALDKNWLKKNILPDNPVTDKKGFLKLTGNEKFNIEESLKIPIIYRAIKNSKNCDIKLYIDYGETLTDIEKLYGGLIFFQDEIEDSWFFFGTRSDKLKTGKVDLGVYKEISAKKAKKIFKNIVVLVKKREELFTFYFSEDDKTWEELGKKKSNMDSFNVGIFAETSSKGSGSALFDKFVIDTMPTDIE